MNRQFKHVSNSTNSSSVLALACLLLAAIAAAQTGAWLTHSHDEQHTALATVASQDFGAIHWHAPVDLHPPQGEIFIHYGSPLVTAANTVIYPVKTGTNSFSVVARNGATGKLVWRQATGYKVPQAAFTPAIGPTISGNDLYIPDAGGTVLVRQNPDQAGGAVSHLYFFGESTYNQNPKLYNKDIKISTPLTSDASGDLYFGFEALASTPAKLVSGLARVAADGTGTWVSAASLSGDSSITEVSISCAPALSLDGTILYIAVDDGNIGYLLAVNSTTLALIAKARLIDPASKQDAWIYSGSSATPTVGPDGDVYFGVLESPFDSHNDRGWLLHFNSDLSVSKIPGSFGWDDTASIVPSSLVSSYKGKSTYLLVTKYNNYCGLGTGDGHNKVAILDPNATENDPILPTTHVMKEVLTIEGVTPDPNCSGGVKEWCINTAAVDPVNKSILVNSEDGVLYRWDLTTNTLSQRITLSPGIGEAYTPTVIGADGTAYAINQAVLDAVGTAPKQ